MFPKQTQNKRWTPEQIKKLRQLANDGVLPKNMCNKIGKSAAAIYCKASKLGITLPRTRTRSPKSGRKLKVPETGYPLIIEFFRLAKHAKEPLKHILNRSGYTYNTVMLWKTRKSSPKLFTFNDILNAFGFKLMIVPIDMNYGDVLNFVTHNKENGNATSKPSN